MEIIESIKAAGVNSGVVALLEDSYQKGKYSDELADKRDVPAEERIRAVRAAIEADDELLVFFTMDSIHPCFGD